MNQHIEPKIIDICNSDRKRTPYSTNVLLVGASSDIGLYLAKFFVRNGYNVIPVDFHFPKCKNTLDNRHQLIDLNLDPLVIIEPEMLSKQAACNFRKVVFIEEELVYDNMASSVHVKVIKNVATLLEMLREADNIPVTQVFYFTYKQPMVTKATQSIAWRHVYNNVFNLYHEIHRIPIQYFTIPGHASINNCSCHECTDVESMPSLEDLFNIRNNVHSIETVNFPYCSKSACTTASPKTNVIMSTYFTKTFNPQYNVQFTVNNFRFIQRWFQSGKKYNAHLVIFHDGLDMDFQQRIKEFYDSVEFIEVSDLNGRTPNDYRYVLYYNYVKEHEEIDRVLMTDIRDVEFTADPFRIMATIGDYMYICLDRPFYIFSNDLDSVYNVLKRCHFWESWGDMFKQHPNYNSGVLGSTRIKMMSYLEALLSDFANTPPGWNCNMGSVAYVTMKYFQEEAFAGYPFQAAFELKINGPQGCGVKHKSYKDSNVRLRF